MCDTDGNLVSVLHHLVELLVPRVIQAAELAHTVVVVLGCAT